MDGITDGWTFLREVRYEVIPLIFLWTSLTPQIPFLSICQPYNNFYPHNDGINQTPIQTLTSQCTWHMKGQTEGRTDRWMDRWNRRKLYTPPAYFICPGYNKLVSHGTSIPSILFKHQIAKSGYSNRSVYIYYKDILGDTWNQYIFIHQIVFKI